MASPLSGRADLCHRQRTTRTGRSARCNTLWATLPTSRELSSLRPREPITMTETSWLLGVLDDVPGRMAEERFAYLPVGVDAGLLQILDCLLDTRSGPPCPIRMARCPIVPRSPHAPSDEGSRPRFPPRRLVPLPPRRPPWTTRNDPGPPAIFRTSLPPSSPSSAPRHVAPTSTRKPVRSIRGPRPAGLPGIQSVPARGTLAIAAASTVSATRSSRSR